jgi:polar amino acid transport system ATP-binding protein
VSAVTGSGPLLEVGDLRKTYGDKVVLADVDLDVAAHDVVCLIGSSGSGKSTLLRCLNLLEDVDDGVIRFEGREVSDPRVDRREVRSRMGMVFQAYNLFPHLTVLDNCTLAPRKVHGLSKAEAEQRARDLLAQFGLADQAAKHPDRLSGGQQQRAALVRALCTHPTLLLLDEITAALDPELVGEVLAIVRDLAVSGTTMVIATHEMAFARDVASRVCFLDGGRILEQGSPEQIFSDPREERTRRFLRRVLPPTAP